MKLIFFFFLVACVQTGFSQSLSVVNLECENASRPLSVERARPSFSWQLQSGSRGVLQTAYQVLVTDDPSLLKKDQGNVWDSKAVSSGQSIHVTYAGETLQPAKTYYWKVRVWDNKDNASSWSEPASFQTGLRTKEDWKGAQWIGYERMPDSLLTIPAEHGKGSGKGGEVRDVLPLFRRPFRVQKPIKNASIFICGLGHFELSLNGKKVGDHFLDPGWTQYDKEALYVAFDVTEQLQQGTNVLGVLLGNGFYFMPRQRYRKHTGAFGFPKMISRLVIDYTDGSREDVISDGSWKTSASPVTFSSIYGGEDYNAKLEQKGWNTVRFNDRVWKKVVVVDGPHSLLAQKADPVKVMDTLVAKKITPIGDSIYVFDLRQNASGIPAIWVKGKRGDTVRIVPGELLKENGSVSQKATGSPVYYEYILKGNGIEQWQPRFSYYGFRYLELQGGVPLGTRNLANKPVVVSLVGLHTRNAAKTVGSFHSSSELFNRTRDLIDWSIRSNLQSVLTDCPHREKLGWLEQVHLMGNSVRFNYDVSRYFQKTLADVRTAQADSGAIPEYAPWYVKMDFMGGIFLESPEWGSAGIITPWYLYQWYGDKAVLEDNYAMMQRYAAYLEGKAKDNILSHGLGDWYDLGPAKPGLAQLTPMGVTATATFYYDLCILSKVAEVLGKKEDAVRYRGLSQNVKEAFNKKFFNKETAQYATGSQTANAMALYMNLVPPEYRKAVTENLVKDIRSRNNSITAGDVGFRYLLQALRDEGRSDVIFDMNSRTDVPGYGYQLAKGATALTESWQALPSVSNNHLMLGHLMEWFYNGLGGIGQAENSVAYKQIVIDPQVVGDLRFVSTTYESPYGSIRSAWRKTEGGLSVDVTVPANTTAVVYLPANDAGLVSEGSLPIVQSSEVKILPAQNGKVGVQIGSGNYQFLVSTKNGAEPAN